MESLLFDINTNLIDITLTDVELETIMINRNITHDSYKNNIYNVSGKHTVKRGKQPTSKFVDIISLVDNLPKDGGIYYYE